MVTRGLCSGAGDGYCCRLRHRYVYLSLLWPGSSHGDESVEALHVCGSLSFPKSPKESLLLPPASSVRESLFSRSWGSPSMSYLLQLSSSAAVVVLSSDFHHPGPKMPMLQISIICISGGVFFAPSACHPQAKFENPHPTSIPHERLWEPWKSTDTHFMSVDICIRGCGCGWIIYHLCESKFLYLYRALKMLWGTEC